MALNDEQARNAAVIVSVGRSLGASQRDLTIALMTALQESGLRNINYGDRDSIGLFQQRDAWGTAAQRLNPAAAARMFFLGGNDGQRGLLDFKNRDQLSLTQAAQAVQVSAFPDAYAKHEAAARSYLAGATGGASISTGPTTGLAAPDPARTVTVNPTVDHTAATLAAQTAAGESPVTPVTTSPVGRPDTPVGRPETGVGRPGDPTSRPDGTGDPAAMAAENAPAEPVRPQALTLDQFRQMYPDAAATRMFTDPGGNGARRNDVVSSAMGYIGTPYAWGGDDYSGVDCSGLVQAVYKNFGIDVPRLSADQMRAGQATAYADLRPGDLIGWQHGERNGPGVEHIAIYAGNNEIVEAPRPGLNVRRRKLSASEIATAEGAHFAQLG